MIISTWNVNSIKVRIHAVLQYLEEFNPDVLVLQETKSTDDNFPDDTIIEGEFKSTRDPDDIDKTKPLT